MNENTGAIVTPIPGKWALIYGGTYGGMFRPEVAVIDKVMKATFSTTGHQWHNRSRVPHVELLAMFDTREEADKAAQAMAGIKGERDRRIAAANEAAAKAASKLLASFNQVPA